MYNGKRIRQAFATVLSTMIMLAGTACSNGSITPADVPPTPVLFLQEDARVAPLAGNMGYASFLTSDGESVYYVSKDGQSLVRSHFDGTDATILTSKVPSYLNRVGPQIFFIAGAESGPVYKIDTDGKGETMISDIPAKSLLVLDEKAFFIDVQDRLVYRILHDGSKKTVVFPAPASSIAYCKDTLYIQPEAPSTGIYSIPESMLASIGPGDSVDIEDLPYTDFGTRPTSLNIGDNLLYYSDSSFSAIFTRNEKGRVREIVDGNIQQPFIIEYDGLYFVDPSDSNRLYRLSLTEPDQRTLVVNDRVDRFVVIGNSIYYKRIGSFDIFRTSTGGGQSQKIT